MFLTCFLFVFRPKKVTFGNCSVACEIWSAVLLPSHLVSEAMRNIAKCLCAISRAWKTEEPLSVWNICTSPGFELCAWPRKFLLLSYIPTLQAPRRDKYEWNWYKSTIKYDKVDEVRCVFTETVPRSVLGHLGAALQGPLDRFLGRDISETMTKTLRWQEMRGTKTSTDSTKTLHQTRKRQRSVLNSSVISCHQLLIYAAAFSA